MDIQDFLTEVKVQQIEKIAELLNDREIDLIYSLGGQNFFVDLRLDDVPILELSVSSQEESDCLLLYLDTLFNIDDFDHVEPLNACW